MHAGCLELAVPAGARGVLKAISAERPRGGGFELTWHDPGGALLAAGLVLTRRQEGRATRWLLQRLWPRADGSWLPGQPAETLAEATSLADLAAHPALEGVADDAPGAALGRMAGRRREVAAAGVRVLLLSGTLEGPGGARALELVRLEGPGEAVAKLALALAESHGAHVPRHLPAALACLAAPEPRRLGAPQLGEAGLEDAFVQAIGHLLDVLLHQLDAVDGAAGAGDEPVHQARVALRRMRSVFTLFRPALGCEALAAADARLKDLARLLGPARDWDVFLQGTARELAAAFPGEASLARLAAAARRERLAAYAALAAWRASRAPATLGVALAGLMLARPWPAPPDDALRAFAGRALHKRARRLRRSGADLAALPLAELHAVRLSAKRLRYACELFAPLFPGRHAGRAIRRLAAVQETLGHLNDGAVAGALMAELGPAGRGHGGGLVRGYVAGRQAATLGPARRAWRKWRALTPFWS